MAAIPPDALQSARSEIMDLMLAQLKTVARANRLPVSGSKAVLQNRILDKLKSHLVQQDIQGFERLRSSIERPDGPQKVDQEPQNHMMQTPPKPTIAQGHQAFSSSLGPSTNGRLIFKDSPFYLIQHAVTPIQELKVRESTRDQIECTIRISQETTTRFARGGDLKVLVYCAAEPISPFTKVDITFPNQIEIRVNGNEVKANLRGLKSKPGSTRPADITDLVHKRPSYENNLAVTYALTTKKYYLLVNIVQQIKAESLVDDLKARDPISKQSVIREMSSKAQDSDIQATSSIMSLKCPLSTLRMDVPCRSTICTHNQCYDALSYLQLQEQAPTWVCPVCNKPAPFETIHIDKYVEDILRSTSSATEQVAIEPQGTWSEVSNNQPHGGHSDSSDDDDLVEITELPRLSALKSEVADSTAFVRTPPQSSREQSTVSTAPKSSGVKRPAAVIDLTLSDDDEESARASKRHTSHSADSRIVSQHSAARQPSSSHSPAFSFSLPRHGGSSGGSIGFGV